MSSSGGGALPTRATACTRVSDGELARGSGGFGGFARGGSGGGRGAAGGGALTPRGAAGGFDIGCGRTLITTPSSSCRERAGFGGAARGGGATGGGGGGSGALAPVASSHGLN